MCKYTNIDKIFRFLIKTPKTLYGMTSIQIITCGSRLVVE